MFCIDDLLFEKGSSKILFEKGSSKILLSKALFALQEMCIRNLYLNLCKASTHEMLPKCLYCILKAKDYFSAAVTFPGY